MDGKLSYDGNSLIIKFGDGVSGLIPTTGAQVKLHYLETAGKAGNIVTAAATGLVSARDILDSLK